MIVNSSFQKWISNCKPVLIEVTSADYPELQLRAVFFEKQQNDSSIKMILVLSRKSHLSIVTLLINSFRGYLRGYTSSTRIIVFHGVRYNPPSWSFIEILNNPITLFGYIRTNQRTLAYFHRTACKWRDGYPILYIDSFCNLHLIDNIRHNQFVIPVDHCHQFEGGIEEARCFAKHLKRESGFLNWIFNLFKWREDRVAVYPSDSYVCNNNPLINLFSTLDHHHHHHHQLQRSLPNCCN